MLQIALHNKQQHCQWRIADKHFVMARAGDETGRWHLLGASCGSESHNCVEINVTPNGVQVTPSAGCAIASLCGADRSNLSLTLPASFVVDDTRMEIADVATLRSTPSRQLTVIDSEQFASLRDTRRGGPAPATLARWLDALASLHRHPASNQQFFLEAARFVVDPIGLDGGVVLRRDGDSWEIIASHLPDPELGILVDLLALDALLLEPRTHFHANVPGPTKGRPELPTSTVAVVVAPLLDDDRQLVGAIYGFRGLHAGNSRRGVRYLEAQLVDLVARSVAGGMKRLEEESLAAARRSALAQRLSAPVVRKVELDAQLLEGQQNEVTVLFADLRRFTELCQRLDTRRTYAILNDVMDCLTDAVLAQEGTIIDYYGDGLSAMWNAPTAQPDHARRAARAALKMSESLPRVSRRWQKELRRELELGVGLHTGPALVGNIGSSQHLKYGPRGATVNLASRIEAATKKLGTPIIASSATQSLLGDGFLTYRLCEARLKGIDTPVDLYAVCPATNDATVRAGIDAYTTALDHYEQGTPADACRLLNAEVRPETAGATRFLARQIQQDCSRKLGRRMGDCGTTCGPTIDI